MRYSGPEVPILKNDLWLATLNGLVRKVPHVPSTNRTGRFRHSGFYNFFSLMLTNRTGCFRTAVSLLQFMLRTCCSRKNVLRDCLSLLDDRGRPKVAPALRSGRVRRQFFRFPRCKSILRHFYMSWHVGTKIFLTCG